jgi:hypothetical protein
VSGDPTSAVEALEIKCPKCQAGKVRLVPPKDDRYRKYQLEKPASGEFLTLTYLCDQKRDPLHVYWLIDPGVFFGGR